MRTALTLSTVALLILAGCSNDPNSDSRINGMDRNKAVIECQKHLASKTPGVELGDFPTVPESGMRKINTGEREVWSIAGRIDGREYACRVAPAGEDEAEVDGAFALG